MYLKTPTKAKIYTFETATNRFSLKIGGEAKALIGGVYIYIIIQVLPE